MSTHKVYSAWQRRREVPQIKMQGRWIENAGLHAGDPIRVRIEKGRIIIEPAEDEPEISPAPHPVIVHPGHQPLPVAA